MGILALVPGLLLSAGWLRADPVEVSRLTLVGVAEADGVTYASLYDAQNGKHFLTSSKDSDEGLELVSVTSNESATIRQNGQTYLLHLSWPAATTQLADAEPKSVAQDIPLPGSVEAIAPKPPEGAKLPLVFQVGNLAKLNLSDDQKAAIGRLREQFAAAVGGGSAVAVNAAAPAASVPDAAAPATSTTGATAPVDPPYQNWLTAQEKSDAQFVMLFGEQAYLLSQLGVQGK